jgi:hypothetical protein
MHFFSKNKPNATKNWGGQVICDEAVNSMMFNHEEVGNGTWFIRNDVRSDKWLRLAT